ncbi:SDR family NAD(P)-dependent oxidoreductase [Nocardia sp. NBC_00508]|uniref:SDR family NAD(P)-dependent oxidoreductase n=1 Tax=Nocardia sp. NBC_00508 TaxID=2975992 RepID=UPI002E8052B9|nr:SDR family NAD(P)-dependent oxidoreductase [Nocardia sp. NBC_00508]WUD66695.1 SDR family NAD(P)-dependent oxidoreductase [Nocardia sp. NBC_00508]
MSDRVALVAGATKGIGEAIARMNAREGASVLVAGRNAERGRAVGLPGGHRLYAQSRAAHCHPWHPCRIAAG